MHPDDRSSHETHHGQDESLRGTPGRDVPLHSQEGSILSVTQDLSGKEDETGESYDVETFLYNKKRTYEMDSEGESATYKKRKTMILEFHKGLQWSSSISTRGYSRELPSLEFLIKADSISNYTFSFMLWKKSKDDDDTFELYG